MAFEPDEERPPGSQPEPPDRPVRSMAMGIPIGAGAGIALGVAMRNIPVGLAIGVAIGIAIGAALDQQRKGGVADAERRRRPMIIATVLGLMMLLASLGAFLFLLTARGQ